MQATHPLTMTTLSTHDTKRSEDVRARISVLSEIPARFSSAIHRWYRMNSGFRAGKSGPGAMPDRNTEYLYYQTLIGAWPLSVERAQAYMLKAAREAKQQTTWTANNKAFEDALHRFIAGTLSHAPFVRELEAFVDKIKDAGRVNSLAQTLMKYTAPGVPDTYQGTELWDLSLVDPDNRRPVDYALRQRLLKHLEHLKKKGDHNIAAQIMEHAEEGLPKMWVTHQALQLRREKPEYFGAEAAYTPLAVEGSKSEHAIAYLRGDSVAVLVPRLTVKLSGIWRETTITLPEGTWVNRLTGLASHGGKMAVKALLNDFPVALLVRKGRSEGQSNA
jgi:(1->4)-alpha-D-glucan 1-alpha-D-glucosylmutase